MIGPCNMTASRITLHGKLAIELTVRNAPASLRPLLDSLGIVPVPDMDNRRAIICATPAELDAARNPLAIHFDARGNMING